jgi:catechol 2,3-dioxygenase-like lactoylglutathione lyase family enzyme
MVGFGAEVPGAGVKMDTWFVDTRPVSGPTHLCWRAASRAAVDAFHAAALAAGGQDNGAPGLRPHYHANYYGAFVIDPDGNNVEAVCHDPA